MLQKKSNDLFIKYDENTPKMHQILLGCVVFMQFVSYCYNITLLLLETVFSNSGICCNPDKKSKFVAYPTAIVIKAVKINRTTTIHIKSCNPFSILFTSPPEL